MHRTHGTPSVSRVSLVLSAHSYFFHRWGTQYDYSESRNRAQILSFAIVKLLCARDDDSGHLSLTTDQQCAVLSQRLALDIDTTAYVVTGSKRNYEMG